MYLSALRTPPRSAPITPVLGSSGRSTPKGTSTPSKPPSNGASQGSSHAANALINTPERCARPRRGTIGTSPKSPRLTSPGDKQERIHGHRCVCEMCTCGMHRCHCKPTIPFEGETTSHAMHHEMPLPARRPLPSCPNPSEARPCEPFEGTSTYKREFIERPISLEPPPEVVLETPRPFNGESSYRRDYTEKDLPAVVPAVPIPKPQQAFHGETSYRQHYKEQTVSVKPKRCKSAPSSGRGPWQDPFEGSSTYKTAYVEKVLSHDSPPLVVLEPAQPFVGQSLYNQDFSEKELPRKVPVTPRVKTPQAFYGQTSYRQHYGEKPLPKTKRSKSAPSANSLRGRPWEEPLEGMSTYRREFIKQSLPREPQPEAVVQTPQAFVGESSYKRDFTEKALPIETSAVPTPKLPQAFHGETSYRQHYNEKPLSSKSPRTKSAPSICRQPWREPLGGMSTYRREYSEKPLPCEQLREVVVQSPVPFEGDSSYKREFTEKQLPLTTPVLPTSKPAQVFHSETSYRQHYARKDLPLRSPRPKSASSIVDCPWADPLGGTSTYRSNYIEHPLIFEAGVPSQVSLVGDQRDFTTTSGTTYVPKELATCPITRMPSYTRYAPKDREHSFWDAKGTRWL